MAKPPAIDFEFFSPASLRTLDRGEQLAALRLELRRRQRSHAAKVEKGDLRSDHAATDEATWEELIVDFSEGAGGIDPDRRYSFTWAAKLNALRGEIMRRRATFPKLVEAGRMIQGDSLLGIAVMECAHRWYWVDGLAFGAEFIVAGDAPRTNDRLREENARRTAWRKQGGRDAPERLELTVDGYRICHIGPGPFTVRWRADPQDPRRSLPANVVNGDGDPLYGPDQLIVPMIEHLAPEVRSDTVRLIAAALNRQLAERQQPSLFDEPEQEAA